MNTIHKFLIDAWNETVLELPAGFKVRMVARTITENKKTTWMWVQLDTSSPTRLVRFYIVGTGHPIPEGVEYCGTYFETPFVWHLFYREV